MEATYTQRLRWKRSKLMSPLESTSTLLDSLPHVEPPRRPNNAPLSPLYTTATLLDSLPQIEHTRRPVHSNGAPISPLYTTATLFDALPQIEPPRRRFNPSGAPISPLYTTATLFDALPQIEPPRHRFNPNEAPISPLSPTSTLFDVLPQIESSLPVNPNGAPISAYCVELSSQRYNDVEMTDALDAEEEVAWIGRMMASRWMEEEGEEMARRKVGSRVGIVQKVLLLAGVGALIIVLRM